MPLFEILELDATRTGRAALLDVEIQTRTIAPEILGESAVAGRQSEDLVRFFDRRFDIVARLIRSDVPRTVFRLLQDIAEPAPRLIGNADVAVALIVLQ